MEQKQAFPMDDAWPFDTVNDAIEATSQQFPALQFDNRIDENCQGFYNENLVQLALVTLITNSAQAGASEVIISADDNNGLTLTVEDNGHGFDPRVLAGEKNTTKNGGTGLGLYFVQLIAERHGNDQQRGRVDYGNRPEGGAFVSLYLP